jgi:ribosomal protein S18 acetylase RimI-like enzyme
LKIRRAEDKDKETFVKIYISNFSNVDEESAKDLFEEKMRNPMGGRVLLAEVDNEVVGIVAIDIIDLMGHIVGLAVNPSHRKLGIGTKLIEAVIDLVPKINANITHVIMTGGTPTTKIATKLGFVTADRFLLVKPIQGGHRE